MDALSQQQCQSKAQQEIQLCLQQLALLVSIIVTVMSTAPDNIDYNEPYHTLILTG
jgi:hypothetical protein